MRVAIVEAGIIDTAMARGAEQAAGASNYPQGDRFSRLFQAVLKNPVDPSVVADKILEIGEGDSWQLRHPVGPDAVPFLEWRAGKTDEEWVAWGAQSDDEWYDSVERDFGIDARPR